jgi:DNA polymerase III subunit delta
VTAVKAGEVDTVLRRLDPRIVALLFYGPDAGLVAERARAAAEQAVDDPADPFQLVRLDGDGVAGDPARLADEAGTIGLFGARRAIWVKPTSRNLAPAVEALLQTPVQDALVVVEAGDLGKSSPLRSLCERSPKALALPCYADDERAVERVVDAALREAGFSIDRDARALLVASLGGDRLATRGELAKLILYARGRSAVTAADVEAVVSDVSSSAVDAVLDAAFGGDAAALDDGYRRLAAEGTSPSTVLALALRHVLALATHRADVDAGRPARSVIEGWRGLHFKRRSAAERQLDRWSAAALTRAIERLQTATLDTRRLPDLGEALTLRVLMTIASEAKAQRR